MPMSELTPSPAPALELPDQEQAHKYHRAKRYLSLSGFVLHTAVLAALLFSGASVALRDAAYGIASHPALALLAYLLMVRVLLEFVGLPLHYLSGFRLEHRYGLSRLTKRAWMKDQLKAMLVGGVLAASEMEILYGALRRRPEDWWLISGLIFIAFFILMANLAPVLLLPIFYKFKPLEDAPLIERLQELCRRAGTRIRGVFEWKLSEKSKKANAALVGLGNTRRIILADTLLENFSQEEIEVVLAHELGHHVHRHMARGILLQSATVLGGCYLLHRILEAIGTRWELTGPADFANLPLLWLAVNALSLLLMPWVNGYSRHMERQADAYALRATGNRPAFISSMEKLARQNLAQRRPHPLMEFIFHSHPSIEKRISFAQQKPY